MPSGLKITQVTVPPCCGSTDGKVSVEQHPVVWTAVPWMRPTGLSLLYQVMVGCGRPWKRQEKAHLCPSTASWGLISCTKRGGQGSRSPPCTCHLSPGSLDLEYCFTTCTVRGFEPTILAATLRGLGCSGGAS